MNIRLLILASVVVASSSTSAVADVYDDCETAILEGDVEAVKGFADKIRATNWLPATMMKRSESCISAAEGVPMVREGGAWMTASDAAKLQAEEEAVRAAGFLAEREKKEAVRLRVCEIRELVTQYDKTINDAKLASQDRRIETLSATVQECSSWYEDSPKEALTNDICNSIFAAGGLPNSTISGPSQLELLLAELSKQNAETELEILVASGMLLEDFTARYISDETKDVYGGGCEVGIKPQDYQ